MSEHICRCGDTTTNSSGVCDTCQMTETRQLIDVLAEFNEEFMRQAQAALHAKNLDFFKTGMADVLASLLTEGPAEHTIVCPTCEGKGEWERWGKWVPCPDNCDSNGRQTVIVSAEVKR